MTVTKPIYFVTTNVCKIKFLTFYETGLFYAVWSTVYGHLVYKCTELDISRILAAMICRKGSIFV